MIQVRVRFRTTYDYVNIDCVCRGHDLGLTLKEANTSLLLRGFTSHLPKAKMSLSIMNLILKLGDIMK